MLSYQGNGRYFQTTQFGLDSGRQFNAYLARIPVGALSFQSGGSPLYFSTEVGPVHYVSPPPLLHSSFSSLNIYNVRLGIPLS